MKASSKPIQNVEHKALALRDLVLNATDHSNGSGFMEGEHISNSYLSMLKRELTGKNQFFGDEKYLKFGNELHKRFLQPKLKKDKLSQEEEEKLEGMLKALRSDPEVRKIMKGAILEQKHRTKIHGQMVKVVVDIETSEDIDDLKSTSCKSIDEFIRSIKKYDYGRQANIYSKAKEKPFKRFIGIGKHKPHNRFIVDMQTKAMRPIMKHGKKEMKLLINVHKALEAFYKFHGEI